MTHIKNKERRRKPRTRKLLTEPTSDKGRGKESFAYFYPWLGERVPSLRSRERIKEKNQRQGERLGSEQ